MNNLDLYKYNSKYFGEIWSKEYVMSRIPQLKDPHDYDMKYDNQYDLIYPKEMIKVEVKATRLTSLNKRDDFFNPLPLSSDSDETFYGTFNRIKTRYADMFILMVVWKDDMKFYLLNRKEISTFPHRTESQGRGSPDEFKISITNNTINDLEKYRITLVDINKLFK